LEIIDKHSNLEFSTISSKEDAFMSKKFFYTLLFSLLTYTLQGAASPSPSEENKKISKAYGHIIAESLNTPGLELDIESLIQGMKDEAAGISSPIPGSSFP